MTASPEPMKERIPGLCFGVAAAALLATAKADLLYHMEQFSLFLPKREFLASFMEQPGGLLELVGAFLTQFCHIPIVGAILIALCLWLLSAMVQKACNLKDGAALLALIPAVFMLLFIMRMDYAVYTMRSYGILFSQILGLTAAVSLAAAYRNCCMSSKAGSCMIPIIAIIGFPLIGIYAFIACLLMIITDDRHRIVNIVSFAAFTVTIPLICAHFPGIYDRINPKYVFLSGMPFLDFPEGLFEALYPILLGVVSIIVLLFAGKASWKLSASIAAASLAVMLALTNWDADFRTVLAMERAAADENWDEVINLAKHSKKQTRAQVLYRNVALFEKGRLTEEMFAYPYERQQMGTSIDIAFICAAPVLHYCGMVNSCDRLSMEASASFTKNIFYFKLMARDALARGERELAEKYIDIVSCNIFEGKWVRRHRAFLDDTESMRKDKCFENILALMRQQSTEFDVVEPVELMLRRNFSNPEYVNEQVYEWQMATMLSWKDAQTPIYCMFNRQDMFPDAHITKGIAEAMALFVSMNGDRDLMVNLVDAMQSQKSILKKFSSFSNDINRTDDFQSDKAKQYFSKQYGRSYWLYYYFIDENEL